MKPSKLAVLLAAVPGKFGARDGWVTSDEVVHRLQLLGFDATRQWVVAHMRAMTQRGDAWLEVRDTHLGIKEYRITQHGSNQVRDRFPGVRLDTPWIPVMRAPVTSRGRP